MGKGLVINEASQHIWPLKIVVGKVMEEYVKSVAPDFGIMCGEIYREVGDDAEKAKGLLMRKYGYRYMYRLQYPQQYLKNYPDLVALYESDGLVVLFDFMKSPSLKGTYALKNNSPLSLPGAGEVYLNLNHWRFVDMFVPSYTSFLWDVEDNGLEYAIRNKARESSFSEWVKGSHLSSTLVHELQHAFDDVRSKGKALQVKAFKGFSDHELPREEYLNLPHEVWARFTQAALYMPPYSTDFRKDWFPKFTKEMVGWSLLSPDMKKRLTKALYKYFDWWQDIRKKKK